MEENKFEYKVYTEGLGDYKVHLATFYSLSDAFIYIEGCDNKYYKDPCWNYKIERENISVESLDEAEENR